MAEVVKAPRVQHGEDRVLNDLQRAVKAVTGQLNDSPLAIEHLANIYVPTHSLSWVGAGNTLTRVPVYRASESGTLLGAAFTAAATLAPHATNYRTLKLERARKGVYSTVMAQGDTTVQGLVENIPSDIPLSTGPEDRLIDVDDVLVLTLDGGGTKPAIEAGLFALYISKDEGA